MFQLLPLALSLGTSILGHIGKKESADQAKKTAAIQAKYSPWTGVQVDTSRAESPSLMPDILAGLGSGLAMSQQNKESDASDAFRQQYLSAVGGGQAAKMAQPTMSQAASPAAQSPWAGLAGGGAAAGMMIDPATGKLIYPQMRNA